MLSLKVRIEVELTCLKGVRSGPASPLWHTRSFHSIILAFCPPLIVSEELRQVDCLQVNSGCGILARIEMSARIQFNHQTRHSCGAAETAPDAAAAEKAAGAARRRERRNVVAWRWDAIQQIALRESEKEEKENKESWRKERVGERSVR